MTSFEQELQKHGSVVFTHRDETMRPLLRKNRDVVLIEQRGTERCRKYDTVFFKQDSGRYGLQRIVKVLDDGYEIIGDNCTEGMCVREDQILGVLRAVRRNGKTIRVNDPGYRFYVRFLRPICRILIRPR